METMNLDGMQQDLEFIFPIISGKISMAINRNLSRNFRKQGLDITPEQWSILAFLWSEDGVTQQKICDATFKDKPSMTRLIDNLVKQKLVLRKPSPTDRRSNQIYITKEGRAIEPAAAAAVYVTIQDAFAGVDADGLKRARGFLKLVFNNMQDALSDK